MKKNRIILFAIAIFTTLGIYLVSPSFAAPRYTISDLGTLGWVSSVARAINESGHVLIVGSPTVPGETHIVIWDSTGGMQDIGFPQGYQCCRITALDLNNDSHVVGYIGLPGNIWHGYLWTEENGFTILSSLGGDVTWPYAINDHGQIAGRSNEASPPTYLRAVLWEEDGTIVNLGTLEGSYSFATDINNRGQVVGGSQTPTGIGHAFLWTEEGGMVDLGTLGATGGDGASADAINEYGQVTGSSPTPEIGRHVFLWTEEQGMQDLGTLGGAAGSGNDINDRGQIVGYSKTITGENHAFIWDDVRGMQDLNDLIPAEPRWELHTALGINNAGQISGSGYTDVDGDGIIDKDHPRSFLLTPVIELTIEAEEPYYVSREGHEAWETEGRITGLAEGPSDFTVTVLNSAKEVVKTVQSEYLKEGLRAYEAWLEPGTYIILITAEGYESLDLHGLEVMVEYDLRIDLKFSEE